MNSSYSYIGTLTKGPIIIDTQINIYNVYYHLEK